MADTAPDIENISDPIERKPFAHQFKKVGIPPIIAGIAKILGRMERVRNSLAIMALGQKTGHLQQSAATPATLFRRPTPPSGAISAVRNRKIVAWQRHSARSRRLNG